MRINDANDPYFASKQIDEMITKYGGMMKMVLYVQMMVNHWI